jgi:3-oxoadipate enol-lactonase
VPELIPGPTGPIAFRRRGAGEPLLLLHPLALAGEVWGPFHDRLADRYDVIAPDARGHGDSGWDGGPFTMDDLADDVEALLEGLGLDAVHLVGMSMGGSTAITFAGTRPARVRRLVLADTTAWYGEQAPTVWAERAERALTTARPRQVPFQVDRWFTEPFRLAHPEVVARVVDVFVRTDSRAHAQASRAMGGLDARNLLPRITAPTLSITGEQDYATPPEMGKYIADHVRTGRHLVLEQLRHLSLIERPDLADLVAAHLAGVDRPAAEVGA